MNQSFERALWRSLVLTFFAALCMQPAAGQTFFGSVIGTVTDASGASVPDAKVQISNAATGDSRTAETTVAGAYQFVNLVPGVYKVDVEKQGFKRLSRDQVTVAVDTAVRIDLTLLPGEITQTVEVTAESPLLQTESASVGQVVEGRNVLEMPLNGRNTMNLIALVPGVVPQGGTIGAAQGNQGGLLSGAHTNNAGWNNYQIGGNIAGQGVQLLDGVSLMVGSGNSSSLIPTQDAIEEFRVSTSNVSSEFGRYGGGVVNMTSRSGSNALHFSLYEFLRNKVLNANYFFSNATGAPRAPFTQNQYGARVGGPIRRDKTFFFFGWENFSNRIGAPSLTFVPTAAQRAGTFSGPVYDPLTTQVVNGVVSRTPFPGNSIPASRVDPTANVMANTVKYWPLADTSLPGGNFASVANTGGDHTQYNVRGDQQIGSSQRLFARYTYWTLADISFNPLNNLTGNPPSHNQTHNAVVGDTVILSSTMTLDVRLSYLRQYYDDKPVSTGQDLSQFGPAWATLANQVAFAELPAPNVTGLYAFNFMNVTTRRYWNNYAMNAAITKVWGQHTLKYGGEIRQLQRNYRGPAAPSGSFTFNTALTSSNATTAGPAGGNAYASFLLGDPTSGYIGTANWVSEYNWYQGYFITDTVHVGRNLTLDLGLRWELPGGWSERHGLATTLLPNAQDPLGQQVGLPLKGQLALVNSSAWSYNTTTAPNHHLFAPRFGFAYRLGAQTVVRGGYGISYLANDLATGVLAETSAINTARTNMAATVNNAGQIPLNTLSNPFPLNGIPGTIQQFMIQPPGRASNYMSTIEGQAIAGPISGKLPMMQQWNLNLQRQFGNDLLFEAGYSGSKGTHLPITTTLDQLSDSYFSMGSSLLASVPNPFAGKFIGGTLTGATIAAGQLLRPYPQFSNVTNNANYGGDTVYHALQVRVQKRVAGGGTLNANYTFSKIIGDSDTAAGFLEGSAPGPIQDSTNLRGERSVLSFNVSHRAVISYVVDLPFGKGKRFLGGVSGIADKFISGWGVNGIVTLQSGFPLALTAQSNALSQSLGVLNIRPNEVAGCTETNSGSAQSRIGQWFNTSCFSQPGQYSLGSLGRVDPRINAAGIANYDFTVFKSVAVREKTTVQFRTEFFNIFNRVQFAPPGVVLGTPSFGAVSSQQNQPRLVQLALRLTY